MHDIEIFSAPLAICGCLFKARRILYRRERAQKLRTCRRSRRAASRSLFQKAPAALPVPLQSFKKRRATLTLPQGNIKGDRVANWITFSQESRRRLRVIHLSLRDNYQGQRAQQRTKTAHKEQNNVVLWMQSQNLSCKLPQYAAVVFAGSHFLAVINISYATEDRSPNSALKLGTQLV